MKSNLTDDELLSEDATKEEQVKEIMKLIEMQEGQLGIWNTTDIHSQLKMYM